MLIHNTAPVGLSVYKRIDHIKKTVAALANNAFAENFDLYVFSDGAKEGDEKNVREVRRFLKTLNGFRSVSIIERCSNNRVFNNREGIKSLLDEHGKVIFLEEDIVTAPAFLSFTNRALDEYQNREDVFAICGYTPPLDFSFYKNDIYLCQRFSAWGFGTWRDRFRRIVMDRGELREFLRDTKSVKEFLKNGTDMLDMIRMEAEGKIDALDVKIFYTQFKYGLNTVAPTKSLTNNIGHDGTGLHCGMTDKFEVSLSDRNDQIKLDRDITFHQKINKQLYCFRSGLPSSVYIRYVRYVKNYIKDTKDGFGRSL